MRRFNRLQLYILLFKDLKKKRLVRKGIGFIIFPFTYILTFVNRTWALNLLLKIFLTDLTVFDFYIAKRIKLIIHASIQNYLLSHSEFNKNTRGKFIILKPYISDKELGIISIHWRWHIDVFAKNYNYMRILKKYCIILESDFHGAEWSLPFLTLNSTGNSLVFCATKDQNIIRRYNLMGYRTIPFGISSDYINPNTFKYNPEIKKEIDITMVAHWNVPIKRHFSLFRALKKIKRRLTVALIGFPLNGYDLRYIRCLAEHYRISHHNILYYQRISPNKVSEILNKSRVSVLTSLIEGANRVCFESFFANVPVIILSENLSIPKDYFNNETGRIVEENDLHNAIIEMVSDYKMFQPRKWALQNLRPEITNKKINGYLKNYFLKNGMVWSEDLVAKQWEGQEFQYLNKDDRKKFLEDYEFVESCHRFARYRTTP